jgi:pimeloyl-ACP methyl ester carboxylesterase
MGNGYRRLLAAATAAFVALGALVAAPTNPAPANAETLSAEPSTCTDLLVITARGSGEAYTDTLTSVVRDAFLAGVGDARTVTSTELRYEAAPMQTLYDDFAQAYEWGGTDWNYFESVNSGWLTLASTLDDAAIACPHQKWLLVGYSQGALVINQAVQHHTDPQRYAGIVLVANPARRTSDEQRNLGTATPGNGLDGFFHLGYDPMPTALAGVTTDLCDQHDNVCDMTHLLEDLPVNLPIDLVIDGFKRGGDIHTNAYTDERLASTTQSAVDRALAVPVLRQSTYSAVACGLSDSIVLNGTMPLKQLNPRGERTLRWQLTEARSLPPAMTGASVTPNLMRKGEYELILGDDGSFAATLPPGHYELVTTLHTDVGFERTAVLLVDMVPSARCGGVSGFITDERGDPLQGVEVSLEQSTDESSATPDVIDTTQTDGHGFYTLGGSYSGPYVLFLSDGPPGTADEPDLFDQYYSTGETTDYSALPGSGASIELGDGSVYRADQVMHYSSGMRMYFYDAATRSPIKGIRVSGGDGPGFEAVSDETGWATHRGLLSYDGNCMSVYDRQGRYVERGIRYYSTLFNPSKAMYQSSSIEGTVRDSAGRVVPGATVSVYRDERWANPPVKDYGDGWGCLEGLGVIESQTTKTDSSGRYVLTKLYGGQNYYISAAADGAGAQVGPRSVTRQNEIGGHITVDLSLPADSTPRPVERLSGTDRYATSAAISASAFDPGVPVAYVASGASYPDALSGAPAAATDDAPVLLVPSSGIPASIADELQRLEPAKIVILGGTTAIPESLVDALSAR